MPFFEVWRGTEKNFGVGPGMVQRIVREASVKLEGVVLPHKIRQIFYYAFKGI